MTPPRPRQVTATRTPAFPSIAGTACPAAPLTRATDAATSHVLTRISAAHPPPDEGSVHPLGGLLGSAVVSEPPPFGRTPHPLRSAVFRCGPPPGSTMRWPNCPENTASSDSGTGTGVSSADMDAWSSAVNGKHGRLRGAGPGCSAEISGRGIKPSVGAPGRGRPEGTTRGSRARQTRP
jgi:hypothetical protein